MENNVETKMIEGNRALCPYLDSIKERITNLNLCIQTILGPYSAFQIGASYYLKLEDYLVDNQLTIESWTNLWSNHLVGLLLIHLRGIPDAPKIVDEQLYNAYVMRDKYVMENGRALMIVQDNENA